METALIETLFHEKLMLYRELAETLKEEKKWIAHADVDALWRVSAKKHAAVAGIETVRTRILGTLSLAGVDHGMTLQHFSLSGVMSHLSIDQRKRLSGVHVALVTLEAEIRCISGDNKRHIESYLSMLDDLMTILTGSDQQPTVYSGRKTLSYEGLRRLHREG